MSLNNCQIKSVPKMCEPLSVSSKVWQRRNRLKRIIKRRWRYMVNLFSEYKKKSWQKSEADVNKSLYYPLKPGDLVRVRSREEIKRTLNKWNQLKGCSFMEEMWSFCGTTQKIYKRVERFLDERDYLIKKSKGIVILEGVICEGTKDFGRCDRSCFFFWREEWLEKIDKNFK